MANFGLASVSYQTPARSADWLKSQSENLIPCAMTIDGLCDAIRRAVELSPDLQTRYANALKSQSHTDSGDLEAAAKFMIDHASGAKARPLSAPDLRSGMGPSGTTMLL